MAATGAAVPATLIECRWVVDGGPTLQQEPVTIAGGERASFNSGVAMSAVAVPAPLKFQVEAAGLRVPKDEIQEIVGERQVQEQKLRLQGAEAPFVACDDALPQINYLQLDEDRGSWAVAHGDAH